LNDARTDGAAGPLEIRIDTKTYVSAEGNPVEVIRDLRLQLDAFSFGALIGPSGCGKTTILHIAAGLDPDFRGQRQIPGRGGLGIVFQEPRLLPWRRVIDNVAFPLELAGVGVAERRERARVLLEIVGVSAFANAYPQQLSGGMRQRTAVARALVLDPAVLLLDEPFSALDALTRERFDSELLDLWQRIGATVIVVTHSISEAVFLADQIVVLSPRPGRVVASVPVALPRPRSAATYEDPQFTRIAAAIRSSLSGTPSEYAAQEAAAPPIHDVLERAGAPAWFDPFGGGA
jgi:NitT/TauT family transport system ATP-binding protein